MHHHNVSNKSLKEFKELCEKEGIKYETEAEYRSAANNLVNLVDLLKEMDMAQRALKKRLETETKGFAMRYLPSLLTSAATTVFITYFEPAYSSSNTFSAILSFSDGSLSSVV